MKDNHEFEIEQVEPIQNQISGSLVWMIIAACIAAPVLLIMLSKILELLFSFS